MRRRTRITMMAVLGTALLAVPLCSLAGSPSTQGLTPEALVAQHIKSLGGTDLLSSVHTHAFVGNSDVEFIQGMTGSIKGGSAMIAADGKKTAIVLKYRSVDYPQEYFSFDGENVSVGHIAPGQRSPLADFIFRFPGIMKKGFLGGTLSLGWPLLDKEGDFGKLKYSLEKVEGKELYQLEWPKSTLGNVRIRMFFEPETFRHVRTEYDVRIQEDVSVQSDSQYLGNMGVTSEDSDTAGYSNILRNDMIPDSIYRLVEKFEDYKKVSGMMLPHKYTLEYSLEGQGHSFIGNWTINATKFVFNNKLDPKIFEAQK
jgi:hypothetical protein